MPRSALRFYDECGLLQPVAVDDATGYRYYDLGQLAQAELIRRLRATEMPVEAVRAFLIADPAGRRRRLEEHVAALEGRLTGLRAAAAEIVAASSRPVVTARPAACLAPRWPVPWARLRSPPPKTVPGLS